MGSCRVLRRAVRASGLCGLLVSSPIWAATQEEKAGARAAATQGEAAFNQKRWADAIDLFGRAESLVHSPVHWLFEARAFAQLGQLVKARETYLEIIREQPSVPSPAIAKAQAAAREELPLIEPRLANVTIRVSGPGAATAAVTMDDVPLPSALIGLAQPVDPGPHRFRARTADAQSEAVALALKEGGTATVELVLKSLGASPALASSAAAQDPGPEAGVQRKGLRTASYVALGVGAVGLAVGTVFALSAKSKYDDANALCPNFPCPLTREQASTREQLGSDGDSAKTASLIGFVAGGVGVVAGATLFMLSRPSAGEPGAVHAYVGPGSLGLRGSF